MSGVRASTMVVGVVVAVASAVQLVVMGRAVSPLVVALVVSFLIWVARHDWRVTRGAVVAYMAAILVQGVHLIEEYRTGFYREFPPVFGLDAWSARRFLLFNLAWFAIFVLGAAGMAQPRRSAFLVALFLALGGGIGNGLGHLALAAQRGGYFPGAYTAVLALVAGSVLLRMLLRVDDDIPVTART